MLDVYRKAHPHGKETRRGTLKSSANARLAKAI